MLCPDCGNIKLSGQSLSCIKIYEIIYIMFKRLSDRLGAELFMRYKKHQE